MRAVVLSAFGQEPTVTDVEVPTPQAGEVRVHVRAASVNGFDLSVGKGLLEGAMEHRFPVVLGKDFAGTVDAVGEGVQNYQVGDRVFGVVTKNFLGDGSFGEYVTVPVAVGIAPLPATIEFTDGAALGLAGTAAANAVDAAALTDTATVLIVGATGGVGQHALQMAANSGARIIATAHSPEEIEAVTALGAAHTVDYTGDVAAQVRDLAPDGVDAVLHFAGDPSQYAPLVKSGGAFASTMLRGPDDVAAEGVQVTAVYANPTPDTLERLADGVATERTTVTIQRTYALDETVTAFADFAAGTVGKLVITIS